MKSARLVTPTPATLAAGAIALAIIVLSLAFLLDRYDTLADLLPVHFNRAGFPNGWQYKTYTRVLMPVLVQAALLLTFGAVCVLLLSRPHGAHERSAPDVSAAAAASEAVALIALVWIAFQGYAAFALVGMWHRGRAGLGVLYTGLEVTGVVLTVLVFARARLRLGRPEPRPFVAAHWHYGQLYRNPADPALFVPTRDGSRWTLNFGRPVAAALMAFILAVGIIGPAVILRLLLR